MIKSFLVALRTTRNSSQNDHFFKTVPARLGAQKEKYIPLQVEEKIRDCGERLCNANSKIGSAIFVANRDL